MLPSPVRLTTRPWWTAMVGSIRSLRNARSRAGCDLRPPRQVCYSRPHPRQRIAAIFRVVLMARPPGVMRHSTKCRQSRRLYVESELKDAARANNLKGGFGVGPTRSIDRRATTAICDGAWGSIVDSCASHQSAATAPMSACQGKAISPQGLEAPSALASALHERHVAPRRKPLSDLP